MTPWPHDKTQKWTPFSEEPVCIVSKADPCVVWAGTKILYSGFHYSGYIQSGPYTVSGQQASGYNYWSGESDIEPISESGWGEIRVPELNQLHKIFVFPKSPCIEGRANYIHLSQAGTVISGVGSCSGKVALVQWKNECSFVSGTAGASGNLWPNCCSGGFWDQSGWNCFNSGLVDIIAFGSEF